MADEREPGLAERESASSPGVRLESDAVALDE